MRLRHARQLFFFLFGVKGEDFFPDQCEVEVSPSTGKLRRIWLDGKCLATVRPMDGMISLTVEGAKRLLSLVDGFRHMVVIDEEGVKRVVEGFDVSPANVVEADPSIIPGSEVLVVDRSRRLVGVGKAVLSGLEMKALKKGTAVKVRHKV
ncbi:MAG: PUA domain-containing protein [Candidatus Caldarchaeum sp.]|nr:PUA domain-containing protein [Candidatus Caldarchaeum sp.]